MGEIGKIVHEIANNGRNKYWFLNKSGKKLPIPNIARISLEDNGKEAEYVMKHGQCIKLIIDGDDRLQKKPQTTATKQDNPSSPRPNPPTVEPIIGVVDKSELVPQWEKTAVMGLKVGKIEARSLNKHINQFQDDVQKGKAYYNFVSLNDQLLCYDKPSEAIDHSQFEKGSLSGIIQCQLSNLTPLFISAGKKKKDDSKEKEILEFFAPTGDLRIPGSSLRGMLREMINIITFGKFNQFDSERRLFTRPMADQDKSFREWYSNTMTTPPRLELGETVKSYNAEAGYLRFDTSKHEYFIQPAKKYSDGRQYKQVKIDPIIEEKRLGKMKPFPYEEGGTRGYYMSSGSAPKKKREWYIYVPDDSQKRVNLTGDDVNNYLKDCDLANPSRKEKINLIKEFDKYQDEFPNGFPLFFIKRTMSDGSQQITIGHTGLFRMSYEKTLGDHVAPAHVDETMIDVAERIFGRIPDRNRAKQNPNHPEVFAHKGFVHISDAHPTQPVKMDTVKKIVQAGPKPTAFQHYLVQNPTNNDGKATWNSDNWLRGHKMYWHQPAHENIQTDTSDTDTSDKMITRFKPVAPENQFAFDIHFSNLSEFELGALMTILNLPESKALKLGMGKGLGFGSVQISASLTLIDRQKRYERLVADGNWCDAAEKADVKEFAKKFQDSITKIIDGNSHSFWEIPRMKQLAILLDKEAGKNAALRGVLEPLAYNNTENRKRNILPNPENV